MEDELNDIYNAAANVVIDKASDLTGKAVEEIIPQGLKDVSSTTNVSSVSPSAMRGKDVLRNSSRFFRNVNDLRAQFEFARELSKEDPKSSKWTDDDMYRFVKTYYANDIANLEKAFAKTMGGDLSNVTQEDFDEFRESFIEDKMNMLSNVDPELATTDKYVIAQNSDGVYRYISKDAVEQYNKGVDEEDRIDFDRMPQTTAQLMQSWTAEQTASGNPVNIGDAYKAFETYNNGSKLGAKPTGIAGTLVGESVTPRTYQMIQDDEFRDKKGGFGKAIAGDVAEGVATTFSPLLVGKAGKAIYGGAKALTAAKGYDRANKILNSYENATQASRIASAANEGLKNMRDVAAVEGAGNLYDAAAGTDRGESADALGYAIAGGTGAMFGPLTKVGKERPLTKSEKQQRVYDLLVQGAPQHEGIDFAEDVGRMSPKAITDDDIALWENKLSPAEYKKKALTKNWDEYNAKFDKDKLGLEPTAENVMDLDDAEFFGKLGYVMGKNGLEITDSDWLRFCKENYKKFGYGSPELMAASPNARMMRNNLSNIMNDADNLKFATNGEEFAVPEANYYVSTFKDNSKDLLGKKNEVTGKILNEMKTTGDDALDEELKSNLNEWRKREGISKILANKIPEKTKKSDIHPVVKYGSRGLGYVLPTAGRFAADGYDYGSLYNWDYTQIPEIR